MQLTIGSNRQRNTDGIVSVEGKRQICLEWGPSGSELLLTMDLYGEGGHHIARLRRNQWTFNDRERFRFVPNAGGFSLKDTKSSQVVLEARVLKGNSVVITRGEFYSYAGRQVELALEALQGVPDSKASTTNLPFAKDEIGKIREALASSQETVQCPGVVVLSRGNTYPELSRTTRVWCPA